VPITNRIDIFKKTQKQMTTTASARCAPVHVPREDDHEDAEHDEDLPRVINVGSTHREYSEMCAHIVACCDEYKRNEPAKAGRNLSSLWMKALIGMLGVDTWKQTILPLAASSLTAHAKRFLQVIGVEPPHRVIDINELSKTCKAYAEKHGVDIPELSSEELVAWRLPVGTRKRRGKTAKEINKPAASDDEDSDEPPPAKRQRRADAAGAGGGGREEDKATKAILARLAALESRVALLEQ
jgi:hypothetical protein